MSGQERAERALSEGVMTDDILSQIVEPVFYVEGNCSACGGSGYTGGVQYVCYHCDRNLPRAEVDARPLLLPCGCPWGELREEPESCPQCFGAGILVDRVPLARILEYARTLEATS